MARMRMEADGMPFLEDALDDWRRALRQMSVDHEEGRVRVMPGEHVEQERRRGRIRSVVEREVDGRRPVAFRHAPDRGGGSDRVEQERERRDVRKPQQTEARGNQQPEHRGWRILLACAGAVLGCALGPVESASVSEERSARQDDRSGGAAADGRTADSRSGHLRADGARGARRSPAPPLRAGGALVPAPTTTRRCRSAMTKRSRNPTSSRT